MGGNDLCTLYFKEKHLFIYDALFRSQRKFVSLKVGVFLIFLIKALRSISKRLFFLFLFLGNFSMGANTYSHHCILSL